MRVGLSQHGGSSVSALAGAVGLALLFAWEYGMAHLPHTYGDIPFGSLFYLASAVGLLAATLFTRNRVPGPRVVAALDALAGLGMAVAGGLLGAVMLPLGPALAMAALAGFGATWMFVRWGTGVAQLGVHESIVSVCCSMVLAAFCKALMAALPAMPAVAFLVCTAVAATVCLGLFERGVRGRAFGAAEPAEVPGTVGAPGSNGASDSAAPAGSEPTCGVFSGRMFARFMILCFGIAAFSFTTTMAQAVLPGGFYVSSGPVALMDALLEALLALALVGWVVALRRRLSFTWSWRALLILTGVALALIPYASFGVGGLGELQRLTDDAAAGGAVALFARLGGFEGVSLALVRTVQSLIVGLWFLALADVVRYNRSSQFATFAIGWCAYALPSALGGFFGVVMLSFGATAVILLSIAAPVLIAVAFLVDEVSLGGRRLFQPVPAGGVYQGFIHSEFDADRAGAAGLQAEGGQPAGETSGVRAGERSAVAPGAAALCPAAAQGMCVSCEVCAVTGGAAPADGLAMAAVAADAGFAAAPVVVDSLTAKCDRAAARYALTGREREVLELLLRGRSKAYIAEALVISENTVRGHVKRLYTKMDVHDRQELINKLEE